MRGRLVYPTSLQAVGGEILATNYSGNYMEIDQHILKVVGTAQLEEELLTDHDYHLNATVNIYKREEVSNQDGTANMVYKAKLLTVQVRNDLGVLIKSSAKKKQSQALRFAIEAYRQEKYPERDEEEFYTYVMGRVIKDFHLLIAVDKDNDHL